MPRSPRPANAAGGSGTKTRFLSFEIWKDPLPEIVLATPSGGSAGLDEFDRRVWVAAFCEAALDADAAAALAAIADAVPGTPVVLFHPDTVVMRPLPGGVVTRGVRSGTVALVGLGLLAAAVYRKKKTA